MRWLLTAHVRRYHRHYRSSGHVWQGRFNAFPIQQDDHLLRGTPYGSADRVSPTAAQLGLSASLRPRRPTEKRTGNIECPLISPLDGSIAGSLRREVFERLECGVFCSRQSGGCWIAVADGSVDFRRHARRIIEVDAQQARRRSRPRIDSGSPISLERPNAADRPAPVRRLPAPSGSICVAGRCRLSGRCCRGVKR